MNRVQANRMARMVGVLEALPRKVYDQTIYRDGPEPPRFNANAQPKDCATSACFAGWTAAAFPRQWGWEIDVPSLRDGGDGTVAGSAAVFFGISFDDAFELVRGDSPANTPKRKAKQLRALLDSYGWEVV